MSFKTNNRYLQEIADGIGGSTLNSIELRNAATDDRALVGAANSTPTFGLATLPAVANASAPTLTEARANYLSSDLTGNLRVVLGGGQLTPVTTTVTTGATVAAGKFSVEFIFSSDFVGTILTAAYTGAADAVKSFEAPAGRTLAAIAYTISAGSARLTTI